jgi:hypothetical protein
MKPRTFLRGAIADQLQRNTTVIPAAPVSFLYAAPVAKPLAHVPEKLARI